MDAIKNGPYSLVATAPSPATTGTTLKVTATTGERFPAAPFNVMIWAAGEQPVFKATPNAEIARCTAISGDELTIERKTEGTTARTVVVGDQIAQPVDKHLIEQAEEEGRAGMPLSLSFTWETATANEKPAAGGIRGNNATLASINTFYVSRTTAFGLACRKFLEHYAAAGIPFIVAQAGVPESTGVWVVTSIKEEGSGETLYFAVSATKKYIEATSFNTTTASLIVTFLPLYGEQVAETNIKAEAVSNGKVVNETLTGSKLSAALKKEGCVEVGNAPVAQSAITESGAGNGIKEPSATHPTWVYLKFTAKENKLATLKVEIESVVVYEYEDTAVAALKAKQTASFIVPGGKKFTVTFSECENLIPVYHAL